MTKPRLALLMCFISCDYTIATRNRLGTMSDRTWCYEGAGESLSMNFAIVV